MEFFQGILNLDAELFLYLNSFHNNFWDTIMILITRKETWLPLYAVIIYYFIKNYRVKSVLILIMLILTVLASDQISVLLKESIQRLRPVHDPAIEHLAHNVLRKGGLYGFVSSHAANAFAILVFSARIFRNKNYWILMVFWALLISYSRIYSGVHYPLDVIGGALLGWLLGWAFHKLLMFVENHFFLTRNPKIIQTELSALQFRTTLLVFSILAITMLITTHLLHHYNYL